MSNFEAKLTVPTGWPESIACQIRFAAVNTVNKVAVLLQTATVQEIVPHAFTLRSRGAGWWQPRTALGFNIRFASRRDAEPKATLGSRADWLPLQEEGGTKARAGGRLAIPVSARPSPTDVIPRTKAAPPASLAEGLRHPNPGTRVRRHLRTHRQRSV